jgi:uncharacterized NAD(P)/FAD-binding protein YdhS
MSLKYSLTMSYQAGGASILKYLPIKVVVNCGLFKKLQETI